MTVRDPTPAALKQRPRPGGLFDPKLLTSLPDAVRKLDPRVMVKNPVMFVVEVGAVAHHRARASPIPACSSGGSWSGCG